MHDGEGAESIGNSVRGALSGGLSGATTTRVGQQGGIGSSAHDGAVAEAGSEPANPSEERDLTLGEQYGGTMERDR